MSDKEIIAEHDRVAIYTNDVSPIYCLDEFFRREQSCQTEQMLKFTNQIKWFTVIVTIAAIISILRLFY